jgi:hypothetical protein
MQGRGLARYDTENLVFREEKLTVSIDGGATMPLAYQCSAGTTTADVLNWWARQQTGTARWELWGTIKRGKGQRKDDGSAMRYRARERCTRHGTRHSERENKQRRSKKNWKQWQGMKMRLSTSAAHTTTRRSTAADYAVCRSPLIFTE